jgi:probable blue pigment (indigoidine) exporter
VWWWRSAVLGVLNVGGFFVLVYVAAQQLPTSIATSIMALAPLALAALGWLLVHERPTRWMLTGAGLGIGGVIFVVQAGPSAVSVVGITASLAALGISSLGAVLTKRWADGTPVLAVTSWQLLFGGVALLVGALAVEGRPPHLDGAEVAGFGFVALIATAVAFGCWFSGLARLPAATVGTVGLLNPVTGALVGTLAAGETLNALQIAGIGLVLLGILVGQAVRPGAPRFRTSASGRHQNPGTRRLVRAAYWRYPGMSRTSILSSAVIRRRYPATIIPRPAAATGTLRRAHAKPAQTKSEPAYPGCRTQR